MLTTRACALLSALPENATGDRLPTVGDYAERAEFAR